MKNWQSGFKTYKNWVKTHWGLLLVVSLAAAYRYTSLASLPAGLFPDEAANGLDVNSILSGDLQPFYERGNGREALFFYMLAPAVKLFGRTPFAHHLVSATLGVLVVLFTYLLMRRWFNEKLALIAGVFAAVSSWYVTMSRTAFRANTAPLFALAFFYFATRVAQSKSRRDYWWSAILAGLSFGLGFYTYISYRMMIPLVGLVFLALLIAHFSPLFSPRKPGGDRGAMLKKYWQAAAAGTVSALAALSWMIYYFIKHPEWLVGRTGQVSIFSPELNNGNLIGTFFEVLGQTIMGFFTQGDLNFRHNVSGFPFLSPLVSGFFALGMLLVVVQSVIFVIRLFTKSGLEQNDNLRRLPYFILTLWFGFMLVPEVLTAEGIPHGLRLVGIIPVVFIIPALFIGEIISELPHERLFSSRLKKSLVNTVLVLFLVAESLYGFYLYFGIAGNSAGYAYAFRSDLTIVSEYLNERNNKEQTYLVVDWFSEQAPHYFTTKTNQPYQVIDPGTLWEGSQRVRIGRDHFERRGLTLQPGDQVVFAQSTIFDAKAFEQHFPNTKIIKQARNRFGEEIMRIYQQD